jgi:hypothetical protein
MKTNPKEFYLKKYENCELQRLKILNFVELIAVGKRPDGTYNYCREALEQKAKDLLNEYQETSEEIRENLKKEYEECRENFEE